MGGVFLLEFIVTLLLVIITNKVDTLLQKQIKKIQMEIKK